MKNHWKNPNYMLGSFVENKNFNITFESEETLPEIESIEGTCGCTKIKYDPANKSITVRYESGRLPKHLPFRQEINKRIVVTYRDKSVDFLHIIGLKLKK